MNTDHLNALHQRLSHERERLAASTSTKERELRTVFVAQMEREIAAEFAFLGLEPCAPMSDDDLLDALS